MTRDKLILYLNKVEEVLNDYYSLLFSVIGINEVHLYIIVPKMANPLIIIIRRRYMYQVVHHACYKLVYNRRFRYTLRDYFSYLAYSIRFVGR
jgi:hypothetical protein